MSRVHRKKDQSALNQLVNALYGDLHRIAARHLRGERSEHTLQATALLHEAYLKLSEETQRQFNGRTHFLAVASRVMRQVLVDHARARVTQKRGGGSSRHNDPNANVPMQSLQVATKRGNDPVEILELNRVLDVLAQEDESLAQVIEMRYFGGMTAEETAKVLGRSVHTVRHDLRLAKAWLRRELGRS
jgi:RNA polymerase sigma factor (TIGR02999 family)